MARRACIHSFVRNAGGNRALGRPRHRWESEIQLQDVGLFHRADHWDKWWYLMKKAMNIGLFPKMRRISCLAEETRLSERLCSTEKK